MITLNFLSSLIASYIKMVNNSQHKPWQRNEDIITGDIRISNIKKYIARSNGKTGSIVPIHESGELTDGGVNWMFVEHMDNKFSIFDNIYLGLGYTDKVFEDNINSQALAFEDLIFLTKLRSEDMRIGSEYIKWTDSIKYDELDFDKNISNIILTDDNNMYYCINNNNSLSTVKPESTQEDVFQTSDNYQWKFIGNLNDVDKEFLSDSTIPITSMVNDDKNNYGIYSAKVLQSVGKFENDIDYTISSTGTGVELNFNLFDDKRLNNIWVSKYGEGYDLETYVSIFESGSIGDGAIATPIITDGKITSINMDNIGINYMNGAVAFVIGDGTGAKLECNIDAIGAITSITPISEGSGFTNAKIIIVPGVNCAVAKAQISRNTVGMNLFNEVRPTTLIINKIINTIEDYINSSGDNSKYNFICLTANIINNDDKSQKLYYVGPKNTNYDSPSINKIDKKYGMILYINKFADKQRADGQEERIKIQIELT